MLLLCIAEVGNDDVEGWLPGAGRHGCDCGRVCEPGRPLRVWRGDGLSACDIGGSPGSVCDDAGNCSSIHIGNDSGASTADANNTPPPPTPVKGIITGPDCAGCTFPPDNAPACAASAPAIKIVYPNDTVLIPPNLNVISVQWTPFGGYQNYEVDFEQTAANPTTDWRVIVRCAAQTDDMQTGGNGTPSGGCELAVDPLTWSKLVQANRGGSTPLSITVRGSTDGTCASVSTNSIRLSIAEQDLIGTYYYWKSTISTNGVGGQIFAKVFGDLTTPEQDVTTAALQNATCNGCHSLSRDGSRMVVYSDDDDSDDEYSDVAGSFLDMTPLPNNPAREFAGGITGVRVGRRAPGFSAAHPPLLATEYVTSNGYPCTALATAARPVMLHGELPYPARGADERLGALQRDQRNAHQRRHHRRRRSAPDDARLVGRRHDPRLRPAELRRAVRRQRAVRYP